MTHSVKQEADVALDQLHHSMNVHHRLLVPLTQIGAHLCFKVLQLKHQQSGTRQSCTDNTITYTFIGTQLHCYCTVIPLGFAGCCADLGRTYQALIWTCMQSRNLNCDRDAPQQCSETHSVTARRVMCNSLGKQFTYNFGLFYTKGYKFSPFSDPPIKQMTYPFPSESGCSGDRSCSRRQQ